MRVIKLCHGAGNGVDKACLMTASNMLIGKGECGDENSCVCDVIRNFIIPTNDRMPEDLLAEVYGDLAWEILGTVTDDEEVHQRRAELFIDVAANVAARVSAETGNEVQTPDKIINWRENLREMNELCGAINGTYSCFGYSLRHLTAAKYKALAAKYAGVSVGEAIMSGWFDKRELAAICRQAILDACKIGDTRPVERVISMEQLAEALDK